MPSLNKIFKKDLGNEDITRHRARDDTILFSKDAKLLMGY